MNSVESGVERLLYNLYRCCGGPESGSGGQGLGVDRKVRGQAIGEDWKEPHCLPLSTEQFCFHAIYFIFY